MTSPRLAPPWLRPVDDALRLRSRHVVGAAAIGVAAGLLYGAAMGSFAGEGTPRPPMMLYAALKVPLLIGVTFMLGLPSWYVLHALLGLRDDAPAAFRALISAQATFTLVLAALAPVTLLWYACNADYNSAILFNGVMFATASFGAQVALRRAYAPLVARRPRHRWVLAAWLVIYAFVGIQMGWVLRPFVGQIDRKVEFFRPEAWDNAYVVVARMIAKAVQGTSR